MKKFIFQIWRNFRLRIPSFLSPVIFEENRIVPLLSVYYSFNDTGISTKYVPSEAEIIEISGGHQIFDKESGKKEILNTYWKTQEDVDAEFEKTHEKPRSIWVWIASTSIVLIFSFSIIQNHVRNRNIERIFRTYYTIPDFSHSTSEHFFLQKSPVWGLLINAFEDRNFDLVRDQFRFISKESPIYDYSRFINSICLIQDHQYQRSLECLSELTKNLNIATEATWYAGLCYIELGNIHSAKLLFQNIKDAGVFEKKAGEILQKLKSVN